MDEPKRCPKCGARMIWHENEGWVCHETHIRPVSADEHRLDPERLKAWEDGAVNGPFAAFGWNDLRNRPYMKKGDLIDCQICGGKHPAECGKVQNKDTGEWEEDHGELLLFYKCGDKSYLAAVSGRKV